MLSKIRVGSANQYPRLQLDELSALSNEIHEYVANGQWEQLVVALDLRQQCLEALFSVVVTETGSLRSLADSILEQDAVFVAGIQEQRKTVEKQILDLGKGRHAMQAYGSIDAQKNNN